MKRLLIVFPLVLLGCNSGTTQNKGNVDSTTISNNAAQVDITISAKDFTAGAMGDNYFAEQRINKKIQITNVQFGGTETIGKGEVNIWGNDGDVHWNGEYMCCRFIFKVSNPDEQQLLNAKGKYGTITGNLIKARDNESSPLGQKVLLKEFVFDQVVIVMDKEVPMPAQPTEVIETTADSAGEKVDAALVNPETGEVDKDERDNGIIVSDKAYFYEEMDVNTRRKAYLIKGQRIKYWDSREGDFNMAFFINNQGKGTSGWMLKSDMKKIQE